MYRYSDIKPKLFTEDGSVMFTKIRDRVKRLLAESGAFTMGAAIRVAGGGDSWTMLACVDRLVELGEIREVTEPGVVAGQDRVFVEVRS